MNNHEGKSRTALITGATSGIGYELSKVFAKNGYNLVLVARNGQKLEQVASEISQQSAVKTYLIPKDLAVVSSPNEIFDELRNKSINIDVLINNAGFNEYGHFIETNLENELQMLQVNIVSLTHLTKLFLPGMVEKNYGKILNVGSTGSFAPGPLNAVYCATKAYVLSFSEAIASELKDTKVTVTALCPGATKTQFAKRAKIENIKIFQGNVMEARDVAETGYRAMIEGKTSIVVGCMNKLTIFSLRFMPRNVVANVAKNMMSKK